MEVEINMINVEDGDAILVGLKKGDKKALIVIDGGRKKFYPFLKARIEELLPLYNDKIDLVVCTHYDNDHLMGIRELISEYLDKIEEIWYHKIFDDFDTQEKVINEAINSFDSGLLLEHKILDFKEYFDKPILEGLIDLNKLTASLKKADALGKIIEPFAGKRMNGWNEVEVISPSRSIYDKNIEALRSEGKMIYELEQNERFKSQTFKGLVELLFEGYKERDEIYDIGDALAKSSKPGGLTSTNMMSIVLLITAENGKYLFTGDCGIEMFEQHIRNWDARLNKLKFLDLPHHGSRWNTSKKMLDVFDPEFVFVSATNAPNRPYSPIVEYLSTKRCNKRIYITNEIENTWYISLDKESEFNRHYKSEIIN